MAIIVDDKVAKFTSVDEFTKYMIQQFTVIILSAVTSMLSSIQNRCKL